MCIKRKKKKHNGLIDIEALQASYHNPEMQEMYINNAGKMLETLS